MHGVVQLKQYKTKQGTLRPYIKLVFDQHFT
jgi:hypothetical protein